MAAVVAAVVATGMAAVVAAAPPAATLTGYPQTVYNFYKQHCPSLPQAGCMLDIDVGCDCDIADAPLRAWSPAGSGGALRLLASVDLGSRGFSGPDVAHLAHNCSLYANSTNDMEISAFANHEWVHSSWYFPENDTLVALTHNEYHCDRPGCPAWPSPGDLGWVSGVTLMSSVDGGSSWQHARPAPAHIVAVAPYAWNATIGAGGTIGFRSPSNILSSRANSYTEAGWYYATVTAGWGADRLGQQAGACMMRTRDVTDPAAWRAWGGAAFNVSLSTNPWTAPPGFDPAAHLCVPFTNMTYPTLAWSSLWRRYVIFGTKAGDDDGGWQFALSDDLLTWDTWTAVDNAGFIVDGGNGTVTPPPPGVPMPGRFIAAVGQPQVWWEDAGATSKYPVGACTPCPGIDACANVTRLPQQAIDRLRDAPAFSCSLVGFNASGISHYFYPTLVDASVAARAPNFDEVGASATLLLVAQRCVDAAGGGTTCSPFDANGLLVRDVVRVGVQFSGAESLAASLATV